MEKEKIKKYPKQLLLPIEEYLSSQLKFLKFRKKMVNKEDPFSTLGGTKESARDARAQSQFDHERSEAIKAELTTNIVQIKKALKRIKSGKYGFCENCGEMINTDRLMIYPEATLCVQCQSQK